MLTRGSDETQLRGAVIEVAVNDSVARVVCGGVRPPSRGAWSSVPGSVLEDSESFICELYAKPCGAAVGG